MNDNTEQINASHRTLKYRWSHFFHACYASLHHGRQWLILQFKTRPFIAATVYLSLDLALRLAHGFQGIGRILLRSIPVLAYIAIVAHLIRSVLHPTEDDQLNASKTLSLAYFIAIGILVTMNFFFPGANAICDIAIALCYLIHNYGQYNLLDEGCKKQYLSKEVASFSVFSAAIMITMALVPSLVIPLTATMILGNILFMRLYAHYSNELDSKPHPKVKYTPSEIEDDTDKMSQITLLDPEQRESENLNESFNRAEDASHNATNVSQISFLFC